MKSLEVVVSKGSQGILVTTCPYPQHIVKLSVGIKMATPAKKPLKKLLSCVPSASEHRVEARQFRHKLPSTVFFFPHCYKDT